MEDSQVVGSLSSNLIRSINFSCTNKSKNPKTYFMSELTETQFGDEVEWLPWRSRNTLRVAFIQIRIH